jgi:hypothetical protein
MLFLAVLSGVQAKASQKIVVNFLCAFVGNDWRDGGNELFGVRLPIVAIAAFAIAFAPCHRTYDGSNEFLFECSHGQLLFKTQ